ncbi:MAG: hypothetical protein KY444_12600, partial [Gemmatimonadetes bacterium]|nr:hypothetical protein [Gemmatimonadota bacterium]
MRQQINLGATGRDVQQHAIEDGPFQDNVRRFEHPAPGMLPRSPLGLAAHPSVVWIAGGLLKG